MDHLGCLLRHTRRLLDPEKKVEIYNFQERPRRGRKGGEGKANFKKKKAKSEDTKHKAPWDESGGASPILRVHVAQPIPVKLFAI
ncbi:hypothetical protein B9Z55_026060 [Caenorhabditis nigoni]|uniref:Uncharacterized protein n=1 Tax=Caenorhabditis nigoni TaxID=1611254 RepID=A0A2G5T1L2_9PELO|nr:hypothetical protein B9Z55_026060 [Caenorhabditis nigoni]